MDKIKVKVDVNQRQEIEQRRKNRELLLEKVEWVKGDDKSTLISSLIDKFTNENKKPDGLLNILQFLSSTDTIQVIDSGKYKGNIKIDECNFYITTLNKVYLSHPSVQLNTSKLPTIIEIRATNLGKSYPQAVSYMHYNKVVNPEYDKYHIIDNIQNIAISLNRSLYADSIDLRIEYVFNFRGNNDEITMFDKTTTNRGFSLMNFKDECNKSCSLQKSSMMTKDCIWLGLNSADPKMLAQDEEGKPLGWVKYPVPEGVLMDTRMHLDRTQAGELAKILQKFAETGELN